MALSKRMNKKAQGVFALMFLMLNVATSQNFPINFETPGFGANWTWTVFENFPSNPSLSITANPNPSGINTSATVAKFNALETGKPWAGCETTHGAGVGVFSLTNANCVIKMMVYKSVISDVGVKFATPAGASTGEIKVANTLINQWEELSFNFSGVLSAPSSIGIDQIIVFPDFNVNPGRTGSNICYFDNITFNASGATSTVTGIPALEQTNIQLFPNPNNGEFTLQLSGLTDANIKVIDAYGACVKSFKAETINNIDLKYMANGLYLIQVWDGQRLIYKHQMIKA